MKTNIEATHQLNSLPRISEYLDTNSGQSLLLPKEVTIEVLEDGRVKTHGLNALDSKKKDLLTIIKIKDAFSSHFEETEVLSPRTYAESLSDIPCHLTVQAILVTKMSSTSRSIIEISQQKKQYGKTTHDQIWIGRRQLSEVYDGEHLLIMNRRVGGWDGSPDRPVIELLGAGGHVPTIWDQKDKRFKSQSITETMKKEAHEELGLVLNNDQIFHVGGFHNRLTNELVVLNVIFINESLLTRLQTNALGNLDENVDGIYIGEIEDVIDMYRTSAEHFAGGESAKPYNFPSQYRLMKELFSRLGY